MKLNAAAVRKCLKSFDFTTLFREHLGWDNHHAQLDVPLGDFTVRLTALAQKRGFVAWLCLSIPDRPTRLKIDHEITKSSREHFVVYADQSLGQQVWQWVRREPGKPIASRDHRFAVSQSGDALIQRLNQIAIGLEEDEKLSIVDVAGRARKAFDADKVTRKFFDRFKTEHSDFLKLIKGIAGEAELEWYTSLMLNRLMFVYFIQKKGFLDNDHDYLRNRLKQIQTLRGKDNFQSFYRYFLVRLFHEGLGKSPNERNLDPVLERLLGKVPFLNGGFFEVHELEESNPDIEIPDEAFEKLFVFFEQYSWHLDERPLRADNEINPDVVGYIFEKYVNQKQMGAYYTKEDITEYISKNSIIPSLFDSARQACPIGFAKDGALWRLLRDDPDRYIYPAVGHGVTCDYDFDSFRNHRRRTAPLPLPADIEAGVSDITQRVGWNLPAPSAFALPTETWREVIARRQRSFDIRAKLAAGEVHEINDLVTLNLDIWQFARDAITQSEGPELLRAFWGAVQKVTVLDPTCGSGAFLFAALRILETLYSDCLERMQAFVQDADRPVYHSPEDAIRAIIRRGETSAVEFKASARWDIRENKHNAVLEDLIVKTVAGFMNSSGGVLLIGVDDAGAIIGLNADYVCTKPNNPCRDQFELWLTQHLLKSLGHLNKHWFHIEFASLDGRDVCRISVKPAPTEVLVERGGVEILFVRQGNSTRSYTKTSEIIAYRQQHWGQGHASQAFNLPSPADPTSFPPNRPSPAYGDFRATLAQIASHPNIRYFILKSSIINNLFGVDIMDEAVEICKLRLFLKLVAQVDSVEQIEPLPDMDFNIRPGNTLVGFASLEEVRRSQDGKFGFGEGQIKRIEEDAELVESTFKQFRSMQTTHEGRATRDVKLELRRRLTDLDTELDRYLAGEYGVDVDKHAQLVAWKRDHDPFHWLVEFFGIMHSGGFDVVIGNPPYVSTSKVNYLSDAARALRVPDLYGHVLLRTLAISCRHARFGMIVPLSITFSQDFGGIRRDLVATGSSWFSSYDNIPAALFAGVSQRCTIWIGERTGTVHSVAPMYRWRAITRPFLIENVSHTRIAVQDVASLGLPKIGNATAAEVLLKIEKPSLPMRRSLIVPTRQGRHWLRFSQSARNFISAFSEDPPCLEEATLKNTPSSKIGSVALDQQAHVFAALSSVVGELYFWYWLVRGDGFDVTTWIVGDFLKVLDRLPDRHFNLLIELGCVIHKRRFEALVFKRNAGKFVGNFNYRGHAWLTRRSDLVLLSGLGADRTSALEILSTVQRVLAINEFAGEKAIPNAVRANYSPLEPDVSAETDVFARSDQLIQDHFGLTWPELEFVLARDVAARAFGSED